MRGVGIATHYRPYVVTVSARRGAAKGRRDRPKADALESALRPPPVTLDSRDPQNSVLKLQRAAV